MEYIGCVNRGQDVLQEEFLSGEVRAWEKIMLGFRTRGGVPQNEVEQYALSHGLSYQEKFDRYRQEGLLSLAEGQYHVTSKGYFVLNGILETLSA